MATITKDPGRQNVLVAEVDFDYTLDEATAVAAVDVPAGARVIGGGIKWDTAWNSATSATAKVGDGAVDNRYATGVNAKTATWTALTVTGYKYAQADTIDVHITNVGAPTAGAARLIVMYVIDDKANEYQS